MALILRNTDNGEEEDITDAVERATVKADAWPRAVYEAIRDDLAAGNEPDDWEVTAERLTANFTRAEIEEDGYNELGDLLSVIHRVTDHQAVDYEALAEEEVDAS